VLAGLLILKYPQIPDPVFVIRNAFPLVPQVPAWGRFSPFSAASDWNAEGTLASLSPGLSVLPLIFSRR
jgi:hypothetical protein